MQRHPESNETVISALTGVLVAGQDLLIDRVDLGLLQLQRYLERMTLSISLMALGGVVFAAALYASDVALVTVLDLGGMRHSTSLLCLAIPNAALGLVLLFAGLKLRS